MIFGASAGCIRILTPLNELTRHQQGTFTGKDYFCPTSGILSFRHLSAPPPEERARWLTPFQGRAANARFLDKFDIEAPPTVRVQGNKL